MTKRPDASTLSVVSEVRANLGRFQALVPDDITVSYELDQSTQRVRCACRPSLHEAMLGALLTGLMVLLFLRDWRSSAIVVITIPFALLAAVVALWGAGQTINIMTLGGLALAVGILVDEATVAIENIHTHLARGTPVARAVLDASGEVVVPRLLAMLSVVAVFVPSFFMTGVSRSLFVPLSLAVGFAMIASFLLSSSLVPVLSVWLLGRRGTTHGGRTPRTPSRLGRPAARRASARCCSALAPARVLARGGLPAGDGRRRRRRRPDARPRDFSAERRQAVPAAVPRARGHEVRVDRAAGARRARRDHAGRRRRTTWTSRWATSACSPRPIRSTPSSCGPADRTRACCRWRSRPDAPVPLEDFQETLRGSFREKFPDAQFSFEPGDIVSRIMNFGAPTPVEVAVMGPDFAASRAFATKVRGRARADPVAARPAVSARRSTTRRFRST